MHRRYRKDNSRITTIIISLLFITLFSYFTFHAVSGERGLIAMAQLSKKVDESKTELDEIRAERIELEHKVSLLRTESLDLDLLDEEARKVLGYASKDETVYTVNPYEN